MKAPLFAFAAALRARDLQGRAMPGSPAAGVKEGEERSFHDNNGDIRENSTGGMKGEDERKVVTFFLYSPSAHGSREVKTLFRFPAAIALFVRVSFNPNSFHEYGGGSPTFESPG
jgi:hypothetical protein